MGHSTLADAICDLGITGGTPIVAVPLNDGSLRAPPIRGQYDDYGGFENLHEEDKHIADLWLQGFNVDLVEKGVGDNTVHDLAVRKNMDFPTLCSALKSGCVQIYKNCDTFWRLDSENKWWEEEEFEWVAELKNVETVLGVEYKELFHIDSPLQGIVRIRGKSYDNSQLSVAQEKLNSVFATVITNRSNKSFEHELLVFTKPQTGENSHEGTVYWDGSLPTRSITKTYADWAFVRQDIWDALLAEKVPDDYDEPCYCFKTRLEDLYKYFDVVKDAIKNRPERMKPLDRPLHFKDVQLHLWNTPFSSYLPSDPGLVGMEDHFFMMALSDIPDTEKLHIVAKTAELLHITSWLCVARRYWKPCHRGGYQDSNWGGQVKYLEIISSIAKAQHKETLLRREESARRRKEWEEKNNVKQ